MKRHLTTIGACCATLALGAQAQTEILTLDGPSAGVKYGHALAGGVDFDGDGWDDLVVGSPFADTGGNTDNGRVQLISGRTHAVLRTKVGNNSGDLFGSAVAVCGDVDGDGVDDVIAGAPYALHAGNHTGMARVFSGATGVTLQTWWGDQDGDSFGACVDGGFDTDHDGHADLIVGAPYGNWNGVSSTGYARTFSGASGLTLFTFDGGAGDTTGHTVATCGDVDNDGRKDFAVGSPGVNGCGGVTVFDGNSTDASSSVLWSWGGAAAGDAFGYALASGFDADGDGWGDVAVGAFLANDGALGNAGSVSVFSGHTGAALYVLFGDAVNARIGETLAWVKDVDQDGARDLLVGAPYNQRALLYESQRGERLATIQGPAGSDFGRALANAGDFDNTGLGCFAVGAPLASPSAQFQAGQAHVYASRPWSAVYCTAGTTTNGCTATMSASGVASASASSGFVLTASGVEGGQSGLIFYGLSGRNALPWGSTFFCVKAPTMRLPIQTSGAATGTCNGVLTGDWLAFVAAYPGALGAPPLAGSLVQAQAWFRDPPSIKTTAFSNAIEFSLAP